jgi:photosystem II stability/assembly factor-like uncharacterized protein
MFASLAGLAAVVLALVLAGCGGDDGAVGLAAPDPGPIHVHGLGVDPADDALYIATHAGLYRLRLDDPTYERVADTHEDLMGFAVAGPGRLLASGHPDVQQAVEHDLPPHLGLVESTDGGASWTTMALEGEADFHRLRAEGGEIYGIDATAGRLLSTSDEGGSWEERSLPRGLIDFVVRPGSDGELLAATESGLAASSDGGRTWQAWEAQPGLLAWPTRDRLYSIGFDGTVTVSRDDGRTWTESGMLQGEPSAVAAADADHLYVALHDATVLESLDGGATWNIRAEPPDTEG